MDSTFALGYTPAGENTMQGHRVVICVGGKRNTDKNGNDKEYLQKFKVTAVDRQYQIWERLPRSFECYSRKMVSQKLNYIHNNPYHEKWKLAVTPEDYKFSSAKFYMARQDDWGFLTNYADYYG